MANKNIGASATVGAMMLVAGGVIGAGMALLFAPQSGERTRRHLARYSRKARNQTEEMVKEAAESVTEVIEDLGDKTADLVDRGGEVAENWRRHLLESIDRGQKNLEKQRQKLTQRWT
jgi:gas vesicle protein